MSEGIILNKPIIAFGMPRSGTTWIGKLLDSHPRVLYRHEPDSWYRMEGIPLFADDFEKYKKIAQEYMRKIPHMCNASICGKQPVFSKAWNGPMTQLVYKSSIFLVVMMERITGKRISHVFEPGIRSASYRLVWKSIESLGRMALFLHSVEDLSALHIVRHPCGYIASVLRGEAKGKFRDATPSSEDYGLFQKILNNNFAKKYGLTLEKLRTLTPIERLAWKWVIYNEYAYVTSRSDDRYKLMMYEEVCSDPNGSMQSIFDHCSLDWNEQTEKFITYSSNKNSKGYYSIYRDPVKAAWQWKKELSSNDVENVRRIVGESEIGKHYEEMW